MPKVVPHSVCHLPDDLVHLCFSEVCLYLCQLSEGEYLTFAYSFITHGTSGWKPSFLVSSSHRDGVSSKERREWLYWISFSISLSCVKSRQWDIKYVVNSMNLNYAKYVNRSVLLPPSPCRAIFSSLCSRRICRVQSLHFRNRISAANHLNGNRECQPSLCESFLGF